MLQRDYIQRLIREFMAALQRLVEKDEIKDRQAAVHELFSRYLGDSTFFNTAPLDDVMHWFEKYPEDERLERIEMLAELFKALCICFGRPVDRFDFAYTDKDGVYHVDRGMTPVSFYEKYIGLALEDYVSVIHAPTADKPFGKTYTVKYLGNVVEGRVRHLNLPMEELKALAVAQLKAGEPVWFGSDCGKFGNRDDGIWDPDSFVYGELLGGLDLGLTKAERLDYRDSAMNHAMVLCGVNLDENGRPDRWKIENSWGETAGRKGYFVASDSWFDQFVYQAVVHKRFLSDEQRQALSAEPIELAPWDPMGSLARVR